MGFAAYSCLERRPDNISEYGHSSEKGWYSVAESISIEFMLGGKFVLFFLRDGFADHKRLWERDEADFDGFGNEFESEFQTDEGDGGSGEAIREMTRCLKFIGLIREEDQKSEKHCYYQRHQRQEKVVFESFYVHLQIPRDSQDHEHHHSQNQRVYVGFAEMGK